MRRVQYEYVHESAVIIRTACLSDAAERCKMYRYAAMYRGEWRIPQWMRFDERFEKELNKRDLYTNTYSYTTLHTYMFCKKVMFYRMITGSL